MSDQGDTAIPSTAELKQLPRWARVAFAARCAGRVRPLYLHARPVALSGDLEAIDTAIAIAANAAARAAHAARADAARVDAYVDDHYVDAAGHAARAAVLAARAAAAVHGARAAAAAHAAVHAAGEAAAIAAGFANSDAVARAIRSDFESIRRRAADERWDDDTPVAQEVFGPMWPEGAPDGWPDVDPVTGRATEQRETGTHVTPAGRQPGGDRVSVYIDPGDADADDIAELFAALSDLHRAHGGFGLEISPESEVFEPTEALR